MNTVFERESAILAAERKRGHVSVSELERSEVSAEGTKVVLKALCTVDLKGLVSKIHQV